MLLIQINFRLIVNLVLEDISRAEVGVILLSRTEVKIPELVDLNWGRWGKHKSFGSVVVVDLEGCSEIGSTSQTASEIGQAHICSVQDDDFLKSVILVALVAVFDSYLE